MNHSTPAKYIKAKDLAKNVEALNDVFRSIPEGIEVKTVLDIRYGLGGWAQSAIARFPTCEVYRGYEMDRETFQSAVKPQPVRLVNRPFVAANYPKPQPFDLVLADFNVNTKLKRDTLDEVLPFAGEWLVFTDVAVSKLHLNYSSYGLDNPSLEAYWCSFAVEGFKLVTFSKRHHAASTALYRRS